MDGNVLQEFWSVKIGHAGAVVKLEDTDGYIRFSCIVLGDGGKKGEPVVLKMETEEAETVLCTLEQGRVDQVPVDLVIEGDVKLTHNSKSANIYINGYKTILIDELMNQMEGGEDEEEEEEEEEEEPVQTANGKLTNSLPKVSANKAMKKAAVKMQQDDDEDEEDDEDDEDDEGAAAPQLLRNGAGGKRVAPDADDDDEESEEDDGDEEDDEEEEPSPPPKMPVSSKKRGMEQGKGMGAKKQKVGGNPAFTPKAGVGKGKQGKKMGKQGRR